MRKPKEFRLFEAVMEEDWERINHYLDLGILPNWGEDACFIYCARNGKIEILERLLESGYEPGEQPLAVACIFGAPGAGDVVPGHLACIKKLMSLRSFKPEDWKRTSSLWTIQRLGLLPNCKAV